MEKIIIGTTPTIYFTFRTVEPADITKAVLTIAHKGEILIERDLSTAEVGENTISWTLTQAETLKLPLPRGTGKPATVMCNWLAGSVRGSSDRTAVWGAENDKAEVIP